MTNRSPTSLGTLLAAAGVGIGIGALIGYAIASGSGAEHSAARTTDEARRAIADQVRQPASIESVEQFAGLLAQLGDEAIPAIGPTIVDPSWTPDPARALLLFQFWIDRDPKGAAEWTWGNAPLGYKWLILDPAIARVAESDPQLALRYVGSGAGADTRFLKPLIRGWVHSGKPGLEDWIRDLGYGFKRQKALGAFARAKIERDGTAAAIAWLEALPESGDGFKDDAFRRLTAEITYADPAAGIEWYQRHREGPHGKGLMTAVVDAWVAVDGPAAMQWISEQPAGKDRDDAVLDAVRTWGMADLQALKRWARDMGIDRIEPWFQPGLPIFARLFGADDPIDGIRWAERIANEPRRRLTIVQIARQWHKSDPAAAEAWLAQSPLTDEERARVVEVRVPRGPKPAAP